MPICRDENRSRSVCWKVEASGLQLDWITEQPAVYALAIPVLGIAAEMVRAATRGDATAVTISETGQDTTGQDTTSNADQSSSADNTAGNSPEASQSVSAKPMPNRRAVMAAGIGLFGLLSIGGWSQDYFTSGMISDTAVSTPDAGYNYGPVYVAFGLAALLPILTATVGTAASLYQGGRRSLAALSTTRLRGALAGLILLAGAVAIGALRVIEPFELLERSTTSGIFSAVTAAGLAAGAAMIWHWSSRLLGSPAAEPLGRIAVGLTCVGGVMLAGADAISGVLGSQRSAPARRRDHQGLRRVGPRQRLGYRLRARFGLLRRITDPGWGSA